MIAPIAFVSEHVETLVELDHDYARFAESLNISHYIRVPALGVQQDFMEGLADVALAALHTTARAAPGSAYICPRRWRGCLADASGKGLGR
jgi:ferrochelatase